MAIEKNPKCFSRLKRNDDVGFCVEICFVRISNIFVRELTVDMNTIMWK